MLRDLLRSRAIFAGFVFFVVIVGGSLFYNWHVQRTTKAKLEWSTRIVEALEKHNEPLPRQIQKANIPSGIAPSDLMDTHQEEVPELSEILNSDAELVEKYPQVVQDTFLVSSEEIETSIYKRVVSSYISRHYKKYPDCQDIEAVLADAQREAEWYVADVEHRKEADVAYEEWTAASAAPKKLLIENGLSSSDGKAFMEQVARMPIRQREAIAMKILDLDDKRQVASERYEELSQQRPLYPKPKHIH